MSAVDKLLTVALQEEGYLEKRTEDELDSKAANAGSNNFTKYARDLYPSLQENPWCDMFVDWCFVQAFGKVAARQLLGGFSAYTPDSAQYYKKRGQYHKDSPKPGDQIFSATTPVFVTPGLWRRLHRLRCAPLRATPVPAAR